MTRKRALIVAVIALLHFGTWVAVFASVFGRVMGGGGSPTGLESLLLHVIGFPLVPAVGEGFAFVAVNSLLWGVVLGLGVPRAWDALKRRKVAA